MRNATTATVEHRLQIAEAQRARLLKVPTLTHTTSAKKSAALDCMCSQFGTLRPTSVRPETEACCTHHCCPCQASASHSSKLCPHVSGSQSGLASQAGCRRSTAFPAARRPETSDQNAPIAGSDGAPTTHTTVASAYHGGQARTGLTSRACDPTLC